MGESFRRKFSSSTKREEQRWNMRTIYHTIFMVSRPCKLLKNQKHGTHMVILKPGHFKTVHVSTSYLFWNLYWYYFVAHHYPCLGIFWAVQRLCVGKNKTRHQQRRIFYSRDHGWSIDSL